MISIHKTYQTRDGRPVEIVTTRARELPKWPVMGYIGDWTAVSFWSPEGIYAVDGRHSNRDLVEVTPKRVLWLNVYPDNDVFAHDSREDADEGSMESRIARLKIEFQEGQFDE